MDKPVETVTEEPYASLLDSLLPMRFGSLLSIPKLSW